MAIHNERRQFIFALGGAAVAWPLTARAQQTGRIARVGVLGPDLNNSVTGPGYQVFLSELRKLGFTEGHFGPPVNRIKKRSAPAGHEIIDSCVGSNDVSLSHRMASLVAVLVSA